MSRKLLSARNLKKIRICGFDVPDIKSLKFSSKHEPGEVWGCSQRKVGDTDGQIKQELTVELTNLNDWIELEAKILADQKTIHGCEGLVSAAIIDEKTGVSMTLTVPISGIKNYDLEIASGNEAIGKSLEFVVSGEGAKINGVLIK